MHRPPARIAPVTAFLIVLVASPAMLFAQASQAPAPPPPPPPPLWAVSIGAGISFTSGNTDTSSINLAYEVKRDGGLPLVYLSKGLYIRGETDDELTVDKALLENRVDYRLTPRLSVFGQLGYLRDRFKEIDYLVTPTGGLSYLFVKNTRVELAGDGSVGLVWEKNTGRDLETDGAVLAGERLTVTLSETARFFQGVAALWKMDDFEDALYTFNLGLAASVTTNSALRVEFLDTYKNRPPDPGIEKNDISFLLSFVYKFPSADREP
jgi:putative salt-induced outer membrane protein YdiY